MNVHKQKQDLLDRLYAPFKKCLSCPLGSLGRTQVVFGEGNPNADLLFIGEGPGKDEDLSGRPFVGRSGKLLNRVFDAIDIIRDDVYITNIVKCRPPNNRKPLPIESKTCKSLLLEKQLKIINPKVICTLGAAAAESLLAKSIKITKIHGIPIDLNGTILVPAYHPAYILRNPKQLDALVADVKTALNMTGCNNKIK